MAESQMVFSEMPAYEGWNATLLGVVPALRATRVEPLEAPREE